MPLPTGMESEEVPETMVSASCSAVRVKPEQGATATTYEK